GYPVATVNEVIHDSGQPFAIVRAIPTAALNRSRYMLLVFSDRRTPEQRATEAAIAQEEADRKGTGQPAANAEQPAVAPAPAQPAGPAATGQAPAAPAAAPGSPAAAPAAPAHPRRQ
ncbi:MAG TPA: rod shape-determining protein MreC, partial [Pseudomonas sp.]|nr:rod shape-determining protein MreC [Pseudomonas sp.]